MKTGHRPNVVTNFVTGLTAGVCDCGWETYAYQYPLLPMQMIFNHVDKERKKLKDGVFFEDPHWNVYVDGLHVVCCPRETTARGIYQNIKRSDAR